MALVQVAELEGRLDAECQAEPSLTESQRQQLATLGADLHALWNEDSTHVELKKRVLRTVINEIVVDVDHHSGHIEMKIHLAGRVHTPLRVRKNQPGQNGNATGADAVELVRKLATGWNDGHIASMLNRADLLTGKGNSWNETRVKNLRRENAIPVFLKSQLRTWKTMLEAASQLGVSNCVISARYERGSIILTTNKAFKQWPAIFNGDSTITAAVLDRLLRHSSHSRA